MKYTGKEKSGIYVIINIINNKMYIGSTSNFKNRCRAHKSLLLRNKHFSNHLQNAVNKYTINAFQFKCIEEILLDNFSSKLEFAKKLAEREAYWISFYKTNINDFGYNTRINPDTNVGHKMSKESRLKMSLAKKGKPLSQEALTALHIYLNSVKGLPNQKAKNYYQNLSKTQRKDLVEKNKKSALISAKNRKVRKLKTGTNLTEKGAINFKLKKGIKVYLYALTGEYLKTFLTITDLLKFFKKSIKNTSSILKVLDKKIYENYFILSYKIDKIKYVQRLQLLNNSNKTSKLKKVVQLDINNNLIKIWNSINEAALFLGYTKSTQLKHYIDNNKVIKNYKFKYIEAYNSDIIGKPDELLENPEMDNQQPSQSLTTLKGSETNS